MGAGGTTRLTVSVRHEDNPSLGIFSAPQIRRVNC